MTNDYNIKNLRVGDKTYEYKDYTNSNIIKGDRHG